MVLIKYTRPATAVRDIPVNVRNNTNHIWDSRVNSWKCFSVLIVISPLQPSIAESRASCQTTLSLCPLCQLWSRSCMQIFKLSMMPNVDVSWASNVAFFSPDKSLSLVESPHSTALHILDNEWWTWQSINVLSLHTCNHTHAIYQYLISLLVSLPVLITIHHTFTHTFIITYVYYLEQCFKPYPASILWWIVLLQFLLYGM